MTTDDRPNASPPGSGADPDRSDSGQPEARAWRRLAWEELLHSRQQFMTLLDSMDASVYVADMDTYELLFVNRKLRELNADARRGRICWETLHIGQTGPCSFCTRDRLRLPDGQPAPPNAWEQFHAKSQRWLQCRDTLIRWRDRPFCRLEIAIDITDRKTMEEELRYRIAFENLISGLSTRFIRHDPEALDGEIERALTLIGEFAQADRCYVFIFDSDLSRLSNTHEWCAAGIAPRKDSLGNIETAMLPWLSDRSRMPNPPSSPDGDPGALTEASEASETHSLVIPLLTKARLLGFVGFDAPRTRKIWTAAGVRALRMVADILANALERQRIGQALGASEARQRALLDAIPDPMFRLDRQGRILDFASGQRRDLEARRETLLGDGVGRFLDEAGLARLLESIGLALSDGGARSLQCSWNFGAGVATHEVRLSPAGTDEVIAIVRAVCLSARRDRQAADPHE